MKNTAHNLTKQMQDLLDQQAELQKKLDWLDSLPVEHRLAHELHEEKCHFNHTDICGYFYGKDFDSREKKEWVEKAKKLLAIEPDYQKVLLIAAII